MTEHNHPDTHRDSCRDARPAGEALGDAFLRLQGSLHQYFCRHVNDPATADDLLQDTFMKALAAGQNGKAITNLPGWLHAVARTTLVDYYRAHGKPLATLDANLPAEVPEDLTLHQELASCLKPFLEELPPIYRDTLMATDFQGEVMSTLANTQGLSVSAIKSRAARARKMLREKMLACCHIEMENGLVSSYRRLSSMKCHPVE